MRFFLTSLLSLLLCGPALAAATTLLELSASEGALGAQLVISGDTLLTDDQGQPRATAADQLLCTLTATAPEAAAVTMPSFSGQSFGDFTLLDQGEVEVRRSDQGLVYERQWFIEPFNPGTYGLPELLIRARATGATITTELVLPQPEITVHAMEAADENLADILPPEAPAPSPLAMFALPGLAVAVLAGGLWLWFRGRDKKACAMPPQKIALTELAAAAELTDRQRIERIDHILRCYLDSRFDLHSLEQTLAEFSPAIEACQEIPPESRITFIKVLARCDLIKFSNLEPEEDEAERLSEEVKAGLAACPLAATDDKMCGRW